MVQVRRRDVWTDGCIQRSEISLILVGLVETELVTASSRLT